MLVFLFVDPPRTIVSPTGTNQREATVQFVRCKYGTTTYGRVCLDFDLLFTHTHTYKQVHEHTNRYTHSDTHRHTDTHTHTRSLCLARAPQSAGILRIHKRPPRPVDGVWRAKLDRSRPRRRLTGLASVVCVCVSLCVCVRVIVCVCEIERERA